MKSIAMVFLNELCQQCGGKIYRHLRQDQSSHEAASVGEVYYTQVQDICERDAAHIQAETGVAPWPLDQRLKPIFDAWLDEQLTLPEFTKQIDAVFAQAKTPGFKSA